MARNLLLAIAALVVVGGVAITLGGGSDDGVDETAARNVQIADDNSTSSSASTDSSTQSAASTAPSSSDSTSSSDSSNSSNETTSNAVALTGDGGQYVDFVEFDDGAFAGDSNDKKLLFFHAVWCTICNSIERNIEAGSIPDDLSIYKVDYDRREDLLQKFGVTFQSAFVQVDADGNEIAKWQGLFGDDISDIVANIQ